MYMNPPDIDKYSMDELVKLLGELRDTSQQKRIEELIASKIERQRISNEAQIQLDKRNQHNQNQARARALFSAPSAPEPAASGPSGGGGGAASAARPPFAAPAPSGGFLQQLSSLGGFGGFGASVTGFPPAGASVAGFPPANPAGASVAGFPPASPAGASGAGLAPLLPPEAAELKAADNERKRFAASRAASGGGGAAERSAPKYGAELEKETALLTKQIIDDYKTKEKKTQERPAEVDGFLTALFEALDIPVVKPIHTSRTGLLGILRGQAQPNTERVIAHTRSEIQRLMRELKPDDLSERVDFTFEMKRVVSVTESNMMTILLNLKDKIVAQRFSEDMKREAEKKEIADLKLARARYMSALAVLARSNDKGELNSVMRRLELALQNLNLEIITAEQLHVELSQDRRLSSDAAAIAFEDFSRKVVPTLQTVTSLIRPNPQLDLRAYLVNLEEICSGALGEMILTCSSVEDIDALTFYIGEAANVVTATACVYELQDENTVGRYDDRLARALAEFAYKSAYDTVPVANIQPPRVGLDSITLSHLLRLPFQVTRQFFSVFYGTNHEPDTPTPSQQQYEEDKRLEREFKKILEEFIAPELEDITDPTTPRTPANDRRKELLGRLREVVQHSPHQKDRDIEEGLNHLEEAMVVQEGRMTGQTGQAQQNGAAAEAHAREAAINEMKRIHREREAAREAALNEKKAREAAINEMKAREAAREAAAREAAINEKKAREAAMALTKRHRNQPPNNNNPNAKSRLGGAYTKIKSRKQKYKKRTTKKQNRKTRKQKGNTRRI